MYKLTLLILLSCLLFTCGNNAAETPEETPAASLAPTDTDEERLSRVAPPPPTCTYLTEAEVLGLFEAGVQVPMPGQRSPGSFNSCQYNLEAPAWSGALVVEMPENETKVQSIKDEVAGAKGADKLTVGGFPARILNDGRIIAVEAKKPFRVKFSALPIAGNTPPFDAAARRELIVKLAEGVMQ